MLHSGGDGLLLVVAAVACLLAILSVTPAHGGYCMLTGLEDPYKNWSTHVRVFSRKQQMDELRPTKCVYDNHNCIECTPSFHKSWQQYSAYCAVENFYKDEKYGCKHAPSTACKTPSDTNCYPQLQALKSMTKCRYKYVINGTVYKQDSFVYDYDIFCSDGCASAAIYDAPNTTLFHSSCVNSSKMWLDDYRKNHPASRIKTKFCENSMNCAVKTRLKPSSNTSVSAGSAGRSDSLASSKNSSSSNAIDNLKSADASRNLGNAFNRTASAKKVSQSRDGAESIRYDHRLQALGLAAASCVFLLL